MPEKRTMKDAAAHTLDAEPYYPLELAAEMRNEIWELAYTTRDGDDEPHDLLNPSPPDSALLRVCHQIYDEAKGFHEAARRRYWSTNLFTSTGYEPMRVAETLEKIKSLHERDVELITRVELPVMYHQSSYVWSNVATLKLKDGVWWKHDSYGPFAKSIFCVFFKRGQCVVVLDKRFRHETWHCRSHVQRAGSGPTD